MNKLTTEELETLIKLVEREREGMRQASYEDENIYEQYLKLGLISMKLNIMLKQEQDLNAEKRPF